MKLVNVATKAVGLACGRGAGGRSNNKQGGGTLEIVIPAIYGTYFCGLIGKI
jgi:hypothetical protein